MRGLGDRCSDRQAPSCAGPSGRGARSYTMLQHEPGQEQARKHAVQPWTWSHEAHEPTHGSTQTAAASVHFSCGHEHAVLVAATSQVCLWKKAGEAQGWAQGISPGENGELGFGAPYQGREYQGRGDGDVQRF